MAYECTHPDWHQPHSVSISGSWGGLWVRYPVGNALMRAGDYIREKNAYLLHRYDPPRDEGLGMLTDYAKRVIHAPVQEQAPPQVKPLTAANVLDALRSCYDRELYVLGSPGNVRGLSYVELGWVRDVRIAGDAVRIDLVLPYPGRQNAFGLFAETMEQEIRERIEGVGDVTVEQVRAPAWSPEQMTRRARRALGLEGA